TILKALHRLNPANGDSLKFDLVTEYPRWRLSRDRREGDLELVRPVEAEFALDQDDIDSLTPSLPAELLPSTIVVAARDYANTYFVYLRTPLVDLIRAAAGAASVDNAEVEELVKEPSLDAAIAKSREIAKTIKEAEPARSKAVNSFPAIAEKHRYLINGTGLEEDAYKTLA